MRITKFKDFSLQNSITQDFLDSFDRMLIESSDDNLYKSVQKKVISDLKLNIKLASTFGAGINALYPIVNKLMSNSKQPIDVNPETVVMLTIAAVSIIFLEERKFKNESEEASLTKDSKSLLEELKMRGVGNGIVKKVMKVMTGIKNIFEIIGRHAGAVIGGIIDMFAYTSLLIPIMNGILYVTGKYELNIDTFQENFLGLSMGIGTIIARHGISTIVNRLKDKFKINKKKLLDEVDDSITKFQDFDDTQTKQDGDLIKEQ